jgi:membrane protease YdiL (CAAX protease family)
MSVQIRRRTAALLEVFGVYLTGAFLSDQVAQLLVRWRVISPQNPLKLLTVHTTNAELLVASRQLFLILILTYGSYFALIIPINWWYRQRGRVAYGLTRAGRSWKALILAALATAALTQWPVLIHTLVDAVHPLGTMEPWRQAFFDMSWRRWQFWLFAGILSYALIPIIEELIFRGYYQRRLAEDWGMARQLSEPPAFLPSHNDALLAGRAVATLRYHRFLRVARWGESLQAGLLKYDAGSLRSVGPAGDGIRDCGRPHRQYGVHGDRDVAGSRGA